MEHVRNKLHVSERRVCREINQPRSTQRHTSVVRDDDGHLRAEIVLKYGRYGYRRITDLLQQDGWRLLGDDLVILQANEILPFLKPFVIYPYHKALFPKIFSENKWRVVRNLKLNKFMSKTIPIVKKIMRPIPGLLAFARKHNPQSMRISPMQIFRKEQLSVGGILNKVVWLDRITEGQIRFGEKSVEVLASKTTSVSMMELFADRLNCLFALCGSGIFDYRKIFFKMYELIYQAYKSTSCFELEIPKSISIDKIGSIVLKHIVPEK